MATHWTLAGRPDGHHSATAALVTAGVLGGVALAGLAAGVVLARRTPRPPAAGASGTAAEPDTRPPLVPSAWVGIGAFLATLAGGASLVTVAANLDAATWRDARLPLLPYAGALALALAAGALGARSAADAAAPEAGMTGPDRSARPGEPAVTIPPGTSVAWAGGCRAGWPRVLAALLAAAAAGAWPFTWDGAAALGAAAAALAWVTSLRMTIGAHGVRVRSSLVGWPSVRIGLDRLAGAQAIGVEPRAWGGWGYRGSLRLFRRAAWVVRRGPGVRFDLRDGRVLVVTVDGADEAAAVANGLLARRADG